MHFTYDVDVENRGEFVNAPIRRMKVKKNWAICVSERYIGKLNIFESSDVQADRICF